jgi:hypothetical protein
MRQPCAKAGLEPQRLPTRNNAEERPLLEQSGITENRIQLLALQLAANPPKRIVWFVEDGRGLAKAREIVELAGFDRSADFVVRDDLNRTLGE